MKNQLCPAHPLRTPAGMIASRKRKTPASVYLAGAFSSTGELGFEPRLTDPESVVLPLHYSPVLRLITGDLAGAQPTQTV